MDALIKDPVTNLPDEELIKGIKEGNKEYFRLIVKRYNQRMYRIAVSYGVYDDDCEEVIQKAYITAYEKIHQFRGEAKFSTWLIRILINECLMLKRRDKKRVDINETVTFPSGDHLNPETIFMEKERKEIIENAVIQLPEKYRAVYVLKEIEGFSIENISEVLSISQVNTKVRLHRARAMMKEFLGNETDLSDLLRFGDERCDRVTGKVMQHISKFE